MSPAKPSPNTSRSRVEAAREGPRVPLVAVAAAALAVVVIVVGAILLVSGGDDGDDGVTAGPGTTPKGTTAPLDQPFGPVTVEGEALPSLPAGGGDDPAVGEPAPTLVGESPSGAAVTIDPADGPMVVAFVAHWCPHCQAEVPRIVELAAGKDEIDGVKLVAVATGTDPRAGNYPPGPWLAEEEWPASVLLDDERASAAAAYGLTGYPYLVAVDDAGTVIARSSGELGDDGLRDFFAQVASAA